jgi:hypothetical protein
MENKNKYICFESQTFSLLWMGVAGIYEVWLTLLWFDDTPLF